MSQGPPGWGLLFRGIRKTRGWIANAQIGLILNKIEYAEHYFVGIISFPVQMIHGSPFRKGDFFTMMF